MNQESVHTGDRRPIASRDWRISRVAAHWLARKNVTPNNISMAGMTAGLAAGAALATTHYAPGYETLLWLTGALFVQLRLLANMLDGMVAIESRKTSPVGELYNEVPDRISDAAGLIGLGYAAGGQVILGYAAAGLAIFTAYVRAMGKCAGAPQEFCGPMAKQQRMFLVTLTAIYCGLTPAEWQPRWDILDNSSGIPAAVLALISVGCIVTSFRRLKRIAGNLRKATSGSVSP